MDEKQSRSCAASAGGYPVTACSRKLLLVFSVHSELLIFENSGRIQILAQVKANESRMSTVMEAGESRN